MLATGQTSELERLGVEARKTTVLRKPSDQENSRLVPQNNHLICVWMPDSFISQRERSNEELKSKGRTREREAVGK